MVQIRYRFLEETNERWKQFVEKVETYPDSFLLRKSIVAVIQLNSGEIQIPEIKPSFHKLSKSHDKTFEIAEAKRGFIGTTFSFIHSYLNVKSYINFLEFQLICLEIKR